ncbi:TetR family transcriptional regulator [Thermostaphylospora chromogena]|uniref:TetR family transcriptional regulator n=1 Tax=Thermostaphylospora chromogena TaxID=35622 RepID=UPI000B89A749|nr:TetR family transcriptional regulator [Thermostaphylospora chromogena]
MAEIAAAAGIGRATLHRCFPSREALLAGLIRAGCEEPCGRIRRRRAGHRAGRGGRRAAGPRRVDPPARRREAHRAGTGGALGPAAGGQPAAGGRSPAKTRSCRASVL